MDILQFTPKETDSPGLLITNNRTNGFPSYTNSHELICKGVHVNV